MAVYGEVIAALNKRRIKIKFKLARVNVEIAALKMNRPSPMDLILNQSFSSAGVDLPPIWNRYL